MTPATTSALTEPLSFTVWQGAQEEVAALAAARARAFADANDPAGAEYALDAYDRAALHAVCLDPRGAPVAGMRLGLGDLLLAGGGEASFFTRRFWSYRPGLALGEVVELSRVWLAPELRGEARRVALGGLWVTTSRLLEPRRCAWLLGTVSLRGWPDAAERALAEYLAAHHAGEVWLEPRRAAFEPGASPSRTTALLPRADAAAALERELERMGQALPSLLRFYMQEEALVPGAPARDPSRRKLMIPVACAVERLHAHRRRLLGRRDAA